MSAQFIVTDRDGTEIGEITDANPRQVVIPLNRVPTGSITVNTFNPLVRPLRQVDQMLVKFYRNDQLLAIGPGVPGYQKSVQPGSAGSRTMMVNFAGVGWRLGARLIEASKSSTGVSYGTPSSMMDRGQMAISIINGLNTAPPPPGVNASCMDTGIRIGSVPPTSSTAVGPWYYQNALQSISSLSGTLDGFDWQIAPTEPYHDSLGVQLGTFNCAVALGSTKSNVVWEYGDGKNNVAAFTEQQDFTGACNRIYSMPTGFPNVDSSVQPPVSVLTQTADPSFINLRGTIYEDVIQDDLVVDDLRNRLMAQNLNVRRLPKTIITFQPIASADPGVVPQYGVDYVEGDIFQFRAVEYGEETINGLFRCYGVTLDYSASGQETVTPLLVSQDT